MNIDTFPFDGGKVEVNHESKTILIVPDFKPDAQMKQVMTKLGWIWFEGWSAELNTENLYKATILTGIKLNPINDYAKISL